MSPLVFVEHMGGYPTDDLARGRFEVGDRGCRRAVYFEGSGGWPNDNYWSIGGRFVDN